MRYFKLHAGIPHLIILLIVLIAPVGLNSRAVTECSATIPVHSIVFDKQATADDENYSLAGYEFMKWI